MKKRKRKSSILILILGLIIGISLIFGSIMLKQHNEKVEQENLAIAEKEKEKEIEDYSSEIEEIEKEIITLETQKQQEFMKNGFSEKYYTISNELSNKNERITELNTKIFKLENNFGDLGSFGLIESSNIFPILLLILGIFVLITSIFLFSSSLLFNKIFGNKSYSEYLEIDESVLSASDITNGSLLKKELYERLEKLLIASSKEDYNDIRKLCAKNMAKSYVDEIDLLKKHKQKRIIKDIENIDSKIVDARKNQDATIVTIVQKVKLYDYVIDSNNEVVSGDKKKRQVQAFKLVFAKDMLKDNRAKKCYNCGAVIKDHSSVKCEYCGTLFDNGNYDWYLVSKVVINED